MRDPAEIMAQADIVDDAAMAWCRVKDRETFNSDIQYFKDNWQSLPGMRVFVMRAALRALDAAGYAVVPKELTAENGMKAALIGDVQISRGRMNREGGEMTEKIDVSWDDTKRIWRQILAAIATAPWNAALHAPDPLRRLLP